MIACCDESGNDKEARWWVFGVAWLPDEQLPKLEADAVQLRQETNCWGEFKWNKVSPTMLAAYSGLLEVGLSRPDLRFTSMVIDKRLLKRAEIRKYHKAGGTDEAYLKFMRLLLAKRIERLVEAGHSDFTILYDNLAASRDLQRTLQDVLRSDMKNISGRAGRRCRFEQLAPIDSKTLHLVQIADLMTGATRQAWDGSPGHSKSGAARASLQQQVEAWAGGALTDESFHPTRYYNLWRWNPAP